MGENLDENEVKQITIRIQQIFPLETENKDLKWLCLKSYKSNILSRNKFTRNIVTSYVEVLSALLDSLKSTLFTEAWQIQLYDDMFLEGIHHEAFFILSKRLQKTLSKSYEQEKIMKLLQKFLQGPSMESLLLYQCFSHEDYNLKYVSKSNTWDELITAIISLPEKVANSTEGHFIKLFSPEFYMSLLLSSVLKVMVCVYHRIKDSQDSSLEFLTKLVGRICTVGYSDLAAKRLVSGLLKFSESDFLWRRISQNFISKMPTNSLENFLTNLLLVIPWYGYLEWILGDYGVTCEKINYFMTVKVIFIRTFKQDIILQNTIGYFASSKHRVSQFVKILNSLLDSWIDQRALQHQSIEQKTYIASALMICAGWVKKLGSEFNSKANINRILKGTQIRLESSEESVRALGMIVGENLIKSFDPDSPPLEFEFRDVDQLNHLKSLMNIPQKPEDCSVLFDEDLKCFEEIEAQKQKWEIESEESKIPNTSNAELDSDDDDLEPYDLSNDIPKSKSKPPLYIRDCMKGLVETENADWAEQCLKHAEDLIKNNPYAANEVAEEMTKIVLHLDDSFSIPNFLAYRHRIMMTLTTQCPLIVAPYLISQFSARDYNIRQRLDILEVLAASSAMLSNSNTLSILGVETNVSKENFTAKKEECWNLIASQKLETKTKRFSKTPKQEIILKENKFSAIAGNFFFPLLNSYDKGNKTLKLFEENNYLLGRFIYTLGIIMISASNSINCQQIATTLLQFLSSVRNKNDVFVRQSVIFAIATAYMGVPPSILVTDMLPEVIDNNEWLQNVAFNDPERTCIEKAIYTLSIFQSAAAEVHSVPQQLKNLMVSD